MARVVIYLPNQERNALYQLAQREYRVPHAQAALIIHKELERLGMLSTDPQPKKRAEEESEEEIIE
jgi:hypothetical protein